MAQKPAMNMPPDVEARIRALPGNDVCADCPNIKPQWASISYGSLVCLECSGQHRSLGVHLSFVRSVQMDSWTEKQIAAMEKSGGNAKLIEYMSSRGINKSMPIAVKYNTKQAAYYRERLSRWLEGKTEPPPDPGRYDPVSGGEAQGAEPLPGETAEEYNARQARLREQARERLRQKFGNQGMGGVGSEPNAGSDGLDLGSLGSGAMRFVGGAVGGAVCGVGSFLKSNVIDNEGLHSSIRGTVGAVGDTASGAWGAVRRSLNDSDGLVSGIKRHTTSEDGALRQGLGWTAGAVGGLWDRALHGVGDLVADGEADGGKAPVPPAPGASPTKGGVNFDDDDWGAEVVSAAPPEPMQEDMSRLAQDLGMKLGSADTGPPVSRSGHSGGTANGPAAAVRAPAAPVLEVTAEPAAARQPGAGSGASPAKPKAKAGLPESDDFFSEFGL